MDRLKLALYGLFLLCASLLVSHAKAQEITEWSVDQRPYYTSTRWYASQAEACNAFEASSYLASVSGIAASNYETYEFVSMIGFAGGRCGYKYNMIRSDGTRYNDNTTYLSLVSRTATAPPPAPSVEAKACELLKGGSTYMTSPGRTLPGGAVCTEANCGAKWSSTLLYITDKTTGLTTTEGDAVFDGTQCTYNGGTASSPSPSRDSCPAGQSASMNGVTVCVGYDPATNVIESTNKTTSSTTTETIEPGTGNVTPTRADVEKFSTVTCEGPSCTVIETTKTTLKNPDGTPTGTNPDGTPKSTTTTATTQKPIAEHCKTNPKDPQCVSREGSTFAGTCGSAFTCTGGDAAMCAIAKAVNEQNCLMREPEEVKTAASAEFAATPYRPKETTKSIGNFDQSNPLGDACPMDQVVTLAGVSATIPLSQACSELRLMGNVLVAFTLLAATIFVLRGLGGT